MKRIIAHGIFLLGITLTLGSCATSQQHMKESAELDLDKGNEKARGGSYRTVTHKDTGKATPSVLTEVLTIFEEFSREPLPTKKIDFYQKFLPELISWTVMAQCVFSGAPRQGKGIRPFFTDPHVKGEFVSPYCAAVKRFQDCFDTIFANIVRLHPGLLKEDQALSVATWNKCNFKSFEKLMSTIQNHCNNTAQCQEWNEVLGIENQTGNDILNWFHYTRMDTIKNGSERALLWRKEAQHYAFVPIIKNSSMNRMSQLWTLDDGNDDFVFSSNGEIERRSGIFIGTGLLHLPVYTISLTLYDGKSQRTGYTCLFPSNKKITEDFMQSLFSHHRQVLEENSYQTFIPLPEKIEDSFRIVGEIINQEINPNNHMYAFLAAYFDLSDLKEDSADKLVTALEETSVSSQAQGALFQEEEEEEEEEEAEGSNSKTRKKIRKTERKKQKQEEAERAKQQQQRSTRRISNLKEKAMLKFPELIKFINACSKLNPEIMQGTVTQKGSHTTLHSAESKSKTIVKPHGKQKGNALSKQGTKQLFKDFGS